MSSATDRSQMIERLSAIDPSNFTQPEPYVQDWRPFIGLPVRCELDSGQWCNNCKLVDVYGEKGVVQQSTGSSIVDLRRMKVDLSALKTLQDRYGIKPKTAAASTADTEAPAVSEDDKWVIYIPETGGFLGGKVRNLYCPLESATRLGNRDSAHATRANYNGVDGLKDRKVMYMTVREAREMVSDRRVLEDRSELPKAKVADEAEPEELVLPVAAEVPATWTPPPPPPAPVVVKAPPLKPMSKEESPMPAAKTVDEHLALAKAVTEASMVLAKAAQKEREATEMVREAQRECDEARAERMAAEQRLRAVIGL
jgi:hypothetical protein